MAVIISDSTNPTYDGNLSTVNGFYRVEAYNLGSGSTTSLALSSTRYIPVTFANAGNCKGVVIALYNATDPLTYGVTVALQENVASVWTDRQVKNLSAEEILGADNDESVIEGRPYGASFCPFEFDTPYAVDTTAGKWRFRVVRYSGSGTAGAWYLITSDATNPFYATWCDNKVSFTDDDTLIIKNTIVIDKSASIASVLGTGTTDYGICAIACRVNDLTDTCNLKWKAVPTASYTFTIKGTMVFGHHSGFRVGTSDVPIPTANFADIYFDSPNVGTITTSRIRSIWGGTSSTFSSKASFYFYGEIPSLRKTTLAQNALSGQPVIVTTDDTSADWAVGDDIVIGKQNTLSEGSVILHKIQSISGTSITLTANLATANRLAGGQVVKFNGYGIKFRSVTNALYGQINPLSPSNFTFVGCDIIDTNIYPQASGYYYALDKAANRSQYLFQDCVARSTSTTMYGALTTPFIPKEGVLVNRCYGFRTTIGTGSAGYANANLKSGYYEISNSVILSQRSSAWLNCSSTTKPNFHDNIIENSYRYGVVLAGLGAICKNNTLWGVASATASQYYTLLISQVINPIEISGNKINKCGTGLVIGANVTLKCLDKNMVFGDEAANTTDILFLAGALIDYELNNPTGITTINTTYLEDTILGSRFRITNYGGTPNDDRNWLTNGYLVRTGDGLPDTTVRTTGTGKFALRFEPGADLLSWSQDVPTGNIQNLTMVVTCFVKINSANFYSGSHTNPTLKVTYDGVTEATAVAVDSTDWQRLTVAITPTTTAGKINVSFEGMTDQTGTDAYFYLDDVSVLLPAGVQLNLGGLDDWDSGLPVAPSIATNLTAMDVWAVDKSVFITPTTMGGHLSKLKNPSVIVDGEIII